MWDNVTEWKTDYYYRFCPLFLIYKRGPGDYINRFMFLLSFFLILILYHLPVVLI